MIKKLLSILIPVCVCSFITAVILQRILVIESTEDPINSSVEINSMVEEVQQSYTISASDGSRNIEMEALDSIRFKLSGVKAYISSSLSDDIVINVKNENQSRTVEVRLSTDMDTSVVEIHPSDITFNPVNGSLTSWLDDVFTAPKCTVMISVPTRLYHTLEIMQGSGIVNVLSVTAKYNDIMVGTGDFSFIKDPATTADEIDVKVGSGTAVVRNAYTNQYSLGVGTGKLDISELAGTGSLQMSDGSARLDFSNFSGIVMNKTGGSADIILPALTQSRVITQITSGVIDIDTDYTDMVITQSGDDYCIGSGDTENFIRIDNTDGTVKIRNYFASSEVQSNSSYSSSDSEVDHGDIYGIYGGNVTA